MRTGRNPAGRWILRLALVLALAAPGCASRRGTPGRDSAPPRDTLQAADAKPAEGGRPKPGKKKAAGKKKAKKAAGKKAKQGRKKSKPAEDRFKLDPDRVLALQMQTIESQRGAGDDCLLRGRNRFTCWLDRFHETWYRKMDNAVRTVDTRGLADNAPYDPELSTFRLRTLMRVGGRSREDEVEVKVRFRGDLALPGLERKIHLVLENADRDALPGTDPMKQEDDTRLGLRTMWRTLRDSELEAGGGLKWRESMPVAYFDLEWRAEREVGGGRLRLMPRGYYFTDNGFGQVTTLSWTKQLGERTWFQVLTAERSSESERGVEFEQSFRFARLRSGRGRGWVVQGSVFPHLASSDWIWDDSLVNVTWRDAFYRRWIYYTITPQLQFPKEDEYEARPSIRIGLEILFGGRVGDLI